MWTSKRTTEETLDVLRDLSALCNELGGKLTHEIFSLVEARDYAAVVDYSIDYGVLAMSDTDDVVYARQIQAFYSKLACLPLDGVNRRDVAKEKFMESETKCLITNVRLRYLRSRPEFFGSTAHAVLFCAMRKISDILGDVPELGDLKCSFGPGANTNVKGAEANPRAKLSAPLQCSNNLSPYVGEVLMTFPCWTNILDTSPHDDFIISWDQELKSNWVVNVDVVPGKLMFVPKNARTDRSIIVEPILNAILQKGVGDYMKGRLLNVAGVDLRDQTLNQKLAKEGSMTGKLATVDLTAASDCVSKELINALLPLDWIELLSKLRTSRISTGVFDETIELEKFSSMGNAFTFELESLIFYGLAHAVCTHLHVSTRQINVFGDDIIVPTQAYPLLNEILQLCGFSINLEKSFSAGPFRESCGADYFYGFDVRPCYQKSPVSDQTLYSIHNWFVRHGEIELARRTLNHISMNTPPLWGPDGYGDGHLIGTYVPRRTRRIERHGWDGVIFDTYTSKTKRSMKACNGDRVLPAYSVYVRSGAESATDPFVVRGSRGYQKISIYTLRRDVFPRS